MNIISKFEKSYTFYGNDASDTFHSITSDGNHYYAIMTDKVGIYVFNKYFRFLEHMNQDESYDLIYFDRNTSSFYYMVKSDVYTLYQCNKEFEIIQTIQLQYPKSYGSLKSIQKTKHSARLYLVFEHYIGFKDNNRSNIQIFQELSGQIHAFYVDTINNQTYVSCMISDSGIMYHYLYNSRGMLLERIPLDIRANTLYRSDIGNNLINKGEDSSYSILYSIDDNFYQTAIITIGDQDTFRLKELTLSNKLANEKKYEDNKPYKVDEYSDILKIASVATDDDIAIDYTVKEAPVTQYLIKRVPINKHSKLSKTHIIF